MSIKARLLFYLLISFLISLCGAPAAGAAHIPAGNISAGSQYVSTVAPAPAYPDTAGAELTDNLFGTVDYMDSRWSGYDTDDPTFTIELPAEKFVVDINLTFLADRSAAIQAPARIELSVSTDGVRFFDYGAESAGALIAGTQAQGIYRFSHRFLNANNIKYVRVKIIRTPDSWIFLDEIVVTGSEPIAFNPPREVSGDTEVSISAILAEWLDVDDLIEKAESAGASSVSLYVGYSSIAWFDIQDLPQKYGLIDHGDDSLLINAINKLHSHNIKVTAVLSSQLWGASPPPASWPLLQTNGAGTATDLFDPQKSETFFVELVDRVMDYNFDGVYVGEPYYKDATYHVGDPQRDERFINFYRWVGQKIKDRNPTAAHYMLLPVHMWLSHNFGAGLPDHGLPDTLKNVSFDYFGLDISSVHEGVDWAGREKGRYETMLALTNRLAVGKKPMAQISIVRFGSHSETIPKAVVLDQIRLAKQYGIKKLQVFDYMYFDLYGAQDKQEIYDALRNINQDYSVSYEPRRIKLLSTQDQPASSDWRWYIADQVNAAAGLAAGAPLSVALDEDLHPAPAAPTIKTAQYGKEGFRVTWAGETNRFYNLEASFDNGATWMELLFISAAGQSSYEGPAPSGLVMPPAVTPKVRLRASNGYSFSDYTEQYLSPVEPRGSISINAGKGVTGSSAVRIAAQAQDWQGRQPALMQIRSGGYGWTPWIRFSSTIDWTLPDGDGFKDVEVVFSDSDGRVSPVASASIYLDTRPPSVDFNAPAFSTQTSLTNSFRVSWAGSDPAPGAGLDSHLVSYRATGRAYWTDWLSATGPGSANFYGTPGKTYYFRVRALDKVGNYSWSKVRSTIVPYNENQQMYSRHGFNGFADGENADYYRGTTRYTRTRGHYISYKFRGRSVGLLSVIGPRQSKAKIYLDGRRVKTIDTYGARKRAARVVYYRTWRTNGTHVLKVINLATRGRPRFDVDGLIVRR